LLKNSAFGWRSGSCKTLLLGGAAVHRCDESFVLIWASAPEVSAAELFSKLLSPGGRFFTANRVFPQPPKAAQNS
jgi:hypothetical protein